MNSAVDELLSRKTEHHFPRELYALSLDLFSIVQYWEPNASGAKRGRLFEGLLCRLSRKIKLPMTEQPGSRTIRGVRAASGIMHENDAILAFPEFTVQFELKHLTGAVSKNDLLIFNQKSIDFLMAEDRRIRRLPLFRIFLSGGLLSAGARRFATHWGICVIEPDRLPLLLLHYLSGRAIDSLRYVSLAEQDEAWQEIPRFLLPIQPLLSRAGKILDSDEALLGDLKTDWVLNELQRVTGDHYWNAMDELDPFWLEDCFDHIMESIAL